MNSHRLRTQIAVALAVAVSSSAILAASVQEQSKLPIYELRISPDELAKLQRSPRSDDRHPAKFIAGGKEYSVEVRYRGDWARTWLKKPLKIFFAKDKEFDGQHVLNLNSN